MGVRVGSATIEVKSNVSVNTVIDGGSYLLTEGPSQVLT